MPNETQVTLRLPTDVVQRGEALAAKLAELPAYAGLRMTTAAALRMALIGGLETLEQAHGNGPGGARPAPRPRQKRAGQR